MEGLGEEVKVVAAVAAVLIALGQLWSVRRSVKADHDRRKKQATLEFYSKLMSETLDGRRSLTAAFGMSRLTDDQITHLKQSSSNGSYTAPQQGPNLLELHHDLKGLLNALERLAAGVRTDIFDLKTIKLIGKSVLLGSVRRYRGYIEVTQKDNPTNFEHLLWLCDQLNDPGPSPTKVRNP